MEGKERINEKFFKVLEEDVYYNDLDNHIPSGLENPKELRRKIIKKEEERSKLKEELNKFIRYNLDAICEYLNLDLKRNEEKYLSQRVKLGVKELIKEEVEKDPLFKVILDSFRDTFGSIPYETYYILLNPSGEKCFVD